MTVRPLLEQAFASRVKVKISYSNKSGRNLKRTIAVFQIGDEYVDAFDGRREAQRVFKIERIGTAQLTRQPYRVPSSYVASEWV